MSVHSVLFFLCRGLFKSDKVVGAAQLKLEGLEKHCDVREIVEVSAGDTYTHMHTHTQTYVKTNVSRTVLHR